MANTIQHLQTAWAYGIDPALIVVWRKLKQLGKRIQSKDVQNCFQGWEYPEKFLMNRKIALEEMERVYKTAMSAVASDDNAFSDVQDLGDPRDGAF